MSATSFPYVGVDLTAGARPTDVAGLNEAGTSVRFARIQTDFELLDLLADVGAGVVAIDSPIGLPRGMCCLEESCPCAPLGPGTGRSAERALAVRGIPCFWTTKRTIIKPMIYRAMALKDRLTAAGYATLEVYPYAVKWQLLGRALPSKTRPEGILRLVAGARMELPDCSWPEPWTPSHDQLDALFCAITARLYDRGETEALGDPREIPIIVPLSRRSS